MPTTIEKRDGRAVAFEMGHVWNAIILAAEHHMACFISMEERMACGIGACLACVCNSREKDAHSNVNNKRICKEGPVFDAQEVEI